MNNKFELPSLGFTCLQPPVRPILFRISIPNGTLAGKWHLPCKAVNGSLCCVNEYALRVFSRLYWVFDTFLFRVQSYLVQSALRHLRMGCPETQLDRCRHFDELLCHNPYAAVQQFVLSRFQAKVELEDRHEVL